MKIFSTTYNVGKIVYCSFIYAIDRKTAESYVKIRNIGECITGQMISHKSFDTCPLPSAYYTERNLLSCIHTLIFYSWIAGQFMGIHNELLRDDGILHEIVHEMQFPDETGFRPIILDRLEDLERLIPGLKTFDNFLFEALIKHQVT